MQTQPLESAGVIHAEGEFEVTVLGGVRGAEQVADAGTSAWEDVTACICWTQGVLLIRGVAFLE